MNKCTERVYNGLIKENPTFVLMLGMCPTLAVTTSAINGLGMGLSTTVVLVLSNMLISIDTPLLPTAATGAHAKSLESNLIAESDSPFVNLRSALRNRVLKQSMRRPAILKSGYSAYSI